MRCSQLSSTTTAGRERQRRRDGADERVAGLGADAEGVGQRLRNQRRRWQRCKFHDIRVHVGQPARDLQREPGLSRPARPGQRHQPVRPHQRGQLLELAVAPDERSERRRQRGRTGPDRLQPLIMAQHRQLQPAQSLARLHAQLAHQRRAQPPVGGQRIRLPPTPVQRDDQVGAQLLPERMRRRQLLQPGDDRGMTAKPQLRVGVQLVATAGAARPTARRRPARTAPRPRPAPGPATRPGPRRAGSTPAAVTWQASAAPPPGRAQTGRHPPAPAGPRARSRRRG